MLHIVYLGVGSNLGDRAQNIAAAESSLNAQDVQIRRKASLYESRPVGPQDQPNYLNTVFEVQTTKSPRELLHVLKSTESKLGRTPGPRWHSRHIDLDILVFDDITQQDDDLMIPHKELRQRAFVLRPLAEIAPNLIIPNVVIPDVKTQIANRQKDQATAQELLAQLETDPLAVWLWTGA